MTLKNNGENNPNLQYSIDGGASWNTYDTTINIGRDQTLYLKGNNPDGWSHSSTKYSNFTITGDVSISGNIMGLLDNGATSGEEGDITAIPCDYCFDVLFKDSTGISSVNEDFLPAANLKICCYDGMFYQCTSLTNAPKLPSMNLTENCYSYMFYGCSSLTAAPDLPATTLADYCYSYMFYGCSNLTTAPNLPATTLANYCYANMLINCISLTTAPDLPATTLANYCYYYMFRGCTSLNSIKISYTGTVADAPDRAFTNWVTGAAATGKFYYKGSDTLANFGFPINWAIIKNW